MSFYIKNRNGEFVPVEFSQMIDKGVNNKMVVVKVGSENQKPSVDDLEQTRKSIEMADFPDDIDNVSLIITPFEIDIGVVDKRELDNKQLYLQIRDGDDLSGLKEELKVLGDKLKKKLKNKGVVVLPTPLKISQYNFVKETLKRCTIRRERQGLIRR